MTQRIITNILYPTILCMGIIGLGYPFADPEPIYQEVHVRSGDTLWSLAAAYAEDSSTDIREVVYHIRKVNALTDAGDLRPGMILRIPVASGGEHSTDFTYIARQ